MKDGPSQQELAAFGFVNVTGWLVLLAAALCALNCLIYGGIVFSLFPSSFWKALAEKTGTAANISPFGEFVLDHLRLLSFIGFSFSVITLFASIGFLRRREWARRALLAILCLVIALTIADEVFSWFASPLADGVLFWRKVLASILTVGLLVFLLWLGRRLVSAKVRAEFCAPRLVG